MKKRLAGLLLALAALGAGGCDGTPDPATDGGGGGVDGGTLPMGPRVAFSWQVRCNDPPCAATDPPARTIDAVDGQDGHEIFCDLTIEGDERRMNFTARRGDAYGLEVRGARMGLEGGRILGSFCQLRVFEEADATILAPCTSNAPSPDRACQIQRLDLRDVEGVPTLLGELRCVGAAVEGDPVRTRDVTASTAASGHASFAFTGCEGL